MDTHRYKENQKLGIAHLIRTNKSESLESFFILSLCKKHTDIICCSIQCKEKQGKQRKQSIHNNIEIENKSF